MITLLFGENSFEIENALNGIISDFDGTPEKIKAEDIHIEKLPDLFMGMSLFASKRLIIIRDLSDNKEIWPALPNWLDKISDDIQLVLIESKIDKRSITYKSLKDKTDVHEFLNWSERDTAKAEKWVIDSASKMNLRLSPKLASFLVRRAGINQWSLQGALEKLSLADEISESTIEELIEPNLFESAFDLFEVAIKGDLKKLSDKLDVLEKTEDIYKLSGLLFSQVFQLAVVSSAMSSDQRSEIAKDFAIHPYVVSKLESVAKKLGKNGVSKVVKIFAKADIDMKTSKSEPWLIIRNALYKIATA